MEPHFTNCHSLSSSWDSTWLPGHVSLWCIFSNFSSSLTNERRWIKSSIFPMLLGGLGWTNDFELLLTRLPCYSGLPALPRRSHGAYLRFHAGSNRSRRSRSAKEKTKNHSVKLLALSLRPVAGK
ncbi:hypothetical protein PsorP6_017129 [Peronosclerospora sorghi]|uniref:Uncharacterized protein n=1 Tax=Peronosclerospora sorghi TaxID=230839 RepID=A0ACC0WDQ3_9STRA|nr:hypothetical protein PsorP6_017129 [Peronosclerospora sorghi]